MLRTASRKIHELVAKAAYAREQAGLSVDERSRAFWITMETQWLGRARAEIEVAEQTAIRDARRPRETRQHQTLQRAIPQHEIPQDEIHMNAVPPGEPREGLMVALQADINQLLAMSTHASGYEHSGCQVSACQAPERPIERDARTEAQMVEADIFILSAYRPFRRRN